MKPLLAAIALLVTLAAPVLAGDAVVVLEEKRIRESGTKQMAIRHVALLKNTSSQSVRALRVTVELYDYFGKLLWARTVIPAPSSLGPGDTATLSVVTPQLEAHRKTRYRFDYRAGGKGSDPGAAGADPGRAPSGSRSRPRRGS